MKKLFITLGMVFVLGVPSVHAQTTNQNNLALVANLQKTIATLSQQLSDLIKSQGTVEKQDWCGLWQATASTVVPVATRSGGACFGSISTGQCGQYLSSLADLYDDSCHTPPQTPNQIEVIDLKKQMLLTRYGYVPDTKNSSSANLLNRKLQTLQDKISDLQNSDGTR